MTANHPLQKFTMSAAGLAAVGTAVVSEHRLRYTAWPLPGPETHPLIRLGYGVFPSP